MTRGQGGSLHLPCTTLSFATPCRFIPALSRQDCPPHEIIGSANLSHVDSQFLLLRRSRTVAPQLQLAAARPRSRRLGEVIRPLNGGREANHKLPAESRPAFTDRAGRRPESPIHGQKTPKRASRQQPGGMGRAHRLPGASRCPLPDRAGCGSEFLKRTAKLALAGFRSPLRAGGLSGQWPPGSRSPLPRRRSVL